jgi:hypothetical protein
MRLASGLSVWTLLWLVGYVPLETYVTLQIAGLPGLLYSAYILNVVGMGLMLWGALAVRGGRRAGAAILAIGWSWTAATFWRATTDRYWWAANNGKLFAGSAELWIAPILTLITVGSLVASMALIFRQERERGA